MASVFSLPFRYNSTLMSVTRKVLFSILLILSAVSLFSVPRVLSQNATTVTKTSYSLYSMTTQTVSNNTFFLSNPFSVPERVTTTCYYQYYEFNATGVQGSEIFGRLTTTSLIDFYIMTPDQYGEWLQSTARSCRAIAAGNALVIAQGIASLYSIDWTVPSTYSQYDFIFFNSYATDATVQIALWIRTRTTVFLPATATVLSTTTESNTALVSQTQTSSPASTQTYSTPSPPMSTVAISTKSDQWPLFLFIIVIIIAAAVLVFLLTIKTRTTKPTVSKATSERTAAQETGKPARKQYCINCGAELPPKSKFCNKCGSAQA